MTAGHRLLDANLDYRTFLCAMTTKILIAWWPTNRCNALEKKQQQQQTTQKTEASKGC